MIGWKVTLGHRWLDTVYFQPDMDAEEVKQSLVGHDGFHPNIRVRREA